MSKWFKNQRVAFIAEMLHIYGFINRKHLQRKFQISEIQATHDLQSFLKNSSGSMIYNLSTKQYESTNK